MKLSLYTAVKDGIANDLHVEAMLRHHLQLADEIIVNEGHSTDGTLERISHIDSKIKIFRSQWETPKNLAWCISFKEAARERCTGDWCIHLDCDEFIPEWEFAEIRKILSETSECMLPVEFINFYGNYKIFHRDPARAHWPERKMIIHKNLPEIEFWGDGSNIKLRGREFSWGTDAPKFTVHHFGMIRDPAILRYKWWVQGRAISGRNTRLRPPRLLFRIFPHNWLDSAFLQDLAIYEGRDISAVTKDPKEFIRDDMRLFRYLKEHLKK